MAESTTAPPRSSRTARSTFMVLLGLGAAGIALLVMDQRSGPSALPDMVPQTDQQDADFFMEQVEVEQYRPDGSLEYVLHADGVQHFEEDARTRLDQPRLTLHQDDQPPWFASARDGVLRRPLAGASEETLTLRDEVELEQTLPDGDWVRLTTPSLRVYPRRQYAETDQDVMIDSLIGRTTATGLEGDLQLGIINFLSTGEAPVSTVLQPEQFK